MTYSKSLQKDIKRLARAAHEREMQHCLELLNQKFVEWKNGKFDAWDLAQCIHEFHNGQARDLYNSYQSLSPESFLIRAVAAGHIAESELPAEMREEVCRCSKTLKGEFS